MPYTWPGEGTEYTIVFEVQDPRLGDIEFDDALLSQLKITETRTIRVVATPPKLELIFHNPREELGVTDDYDEIFYLVKYSANQNTTKIYFLTMVPLTLAPILGKITGKTGSFITKQQLMMALVKI